MFDNESPLDERDKDILKDIQKGVRLKHVRTNDRSKPNLRGTKINVFFEKLDQQLSSFPK